ncbi:MAG: hypothetical protein JJ975_17660 [Bacteroidia bacterium]|nr:hypothetical protein [Bacteroidia bacterium]
MENRLWSATERIDTVEISEEVVNLDQVDNAINLPKLNGMNNEITIEFWMKRSSTTSNETIYDNFHGSPNSSRACIISLNGGKLQFAVINNAQASSYVYYTYNGTVCDNQWHHIALTIDASDSLRYYVDGVQVYKRKGVGVTTDFSTFNQARIGARDNANPLLNKYNGALRQFAIWRIPLSSDDISTSYSQGEVQPHSGIVQYFPFNEGKGIRFVDQISKDTADTEYPSNGMNWTSHSYTTERKTTHGYRFGFNGKERDDEVSGAGNTIAFEARIYDSRLGRFFSVDPMISNYSDQSSYSFAVNSPIKLIDRKGMAPALPPWLRKVGAALGLVDDKKLEGGTLDVTVLQRDKRSKLPTDEGGWLDGVVQNVKDFWNELSKGKPIQEFHMGISISGKFGPLSGSYGPEVAIGNSKEPGIFSDEPGFQIAGRIKAGGGMSGVKLLDFLDPKSYRGSGVQVKFKIGVTAADEGTVNTKEGWSSSTEISREVSVLGSGAAVKQSSSDDGSKTSLDLEFKVGQKADVKLGKIDVKRKRSYTASRIWD